MALIKTFCWALIFITRILKLFYKQIQNDKFFKKKVQI